MTPNQIAAGNRGWRLQFGFAVQVFWSRVPLVVSLRDRALCRIIQHQKLSEN
jgi:hypothetical protein